MEAIDTSNYSGKYPVEWLYNQVENGGVSLAVIGTQLADITKHQFLIGREAGIMLRAYCQLYFNQSPEEQVQRSIDLCAGFFVQKLYLACEDSYASNLSEAKTVDFIRRAAAQAVGKMRTGIYTRKNWWIPQTGNSDVFKEWPLWDANYGNGTLEQGQGTLIPVDYGGWEEPEMRQYADKIVEGVAVDFNVYRAEPSPPWK